MDTEKKINDLLKEAMKSGDKVRLMAVRTLKTAIMTEKTRSADEMTEDRIVKVLASHRKKMQGALDQYIEVKREDLIASARSEIALCDELLPAQLTEEDIVKAVDEMIAASGASSMQDLGKVMGPVMKKLAGQADGNLVRSIVSKRLGG